MRQLIFTEHPPIVTVVGHTKPVCSALDKVMEYRGDTWGREPFTAPSSIAVLAGSGCYRSFANKAGRTDEEYLQRSIVEHNHGSVLEHVSINFYVQSLPRSVQLELVRHRVGVAYSFLSQRFTDDFTEIVIPPLMRLPEHEDLKRTFMAFSLTMFNAYEDMAENMSAEDTTDEKTLRRKRVKEAARAVLSNAVGSDGMVTMNVRQLRHFIKMRSDTHADASIREFAYELYRAALPIVPEMLADVQEVPQEWGVPMLVLGGEN